MKALNVVPAYGRDYAEEWDARCDWFAGKDFKIVGGPYVSVRDRELLRKRYCVVAIHFDDELHERPLAATTAQAELDRYSRFRKHTLVATTARAELDHAIALSCVKDEVARRRVADAVSAK